MSAEAGVPPTVQKSTYRGRQLATSTVVTARSAWESIFMVEAVRSCPERCAFCLASYVTLPFRVSPVHEMLLPTIDAALKKTNRIGILGASVTQHPQFDVLLSELKREKYDGMRLSIASVRTNTVSENLASTLVKRGTKSITIAVESGSERLRKVCGPIERFVFFENLGLLLLSNAFLIFFVRDCISHIIRNVDHQQEARQ